MTRVLILSAIAAVATVGLRTAPAAQGSRQVSAAHLISRAGIGAIRLGMTLDAARHDLRSGTFARTSDGDGLALVEVTLAPGESVVAWADEDDPGQPIDWSKKIKRLETFSAAFHTADGVHAGALVTQVERLLGVVKDITQSEIESREYVVFERQPGFLTLRLDYTGIFEPGERRTRQYKPGAKILSIAVSVP